MPAPWDAKSEQIQPASVFLPAASPPGTLLATSAVVMQRHTAEPAQELTVAEPAVAVEPFVIDLTNIRCREDCDGR